MLLKQLVTLAWYSFSSLTALWGALTANRAYSRILSRSKGSDEKILIPVDGSENALRALKQAIAVARSSADAELHLLHVRDPIPPHLHDNFSVENIEKAEEKVADRILQAAKQLCDEAAVS